MKKLALCMSLAITMPLLAIISDADYQQQVNQTIGTALASIMPNIRVQRTLQTDDQYALVVFAQKNNFPAVQYLIETKKVNPNFVKLGFSPLAAAVKNGNTELVQYLLEHGAQPDFLLDTYGRKASAHAQGKQEIIELLEYFKEKKTKL